MIHQLIFAAPKPGMTDQEFHRYWVEEHAVRYASKIPQIKKYAVDTTVNPLGSDEPLWKGIAEIWLENEEEQLASLQTPEFLEGARLDEPRWAAFWQSVVLDTDTEVVVPGVPQDMVQPGVKLVILTKRKEGLSREEFRRHSREVHAPLVKAVPGVTRYYQSFTRDSWYGISEPPFDAAYHIWFDSLAGLEAAQRGAEQAAVEADYKNFVNQQYTHTVPVRENWVLGPQAR
ncbi:EthD family reductase [Streptomyces sp. NPDC059009]|uniref:EthD domain-containing protein n=1 Tax=Streptomyces sp. NPDC059009 TaxID=3346694 RepID=UPI0036CFBF19